MNERDRQLKLWEGGGTLRVGYRRIELLNRERLVARTAPVAFDAATR